MYHKTYEANFSEYVSIYHQYDRLQYMYKKKTDSTISNTHDAPQIKCECSGPIEAESDFQKDKWVSPSDACLEHTQLVPPVTSKIHRALAHEGLLGIGDQVLQMKHKVFLQKLNHLIKENDSAWTYILRNQKEIIEMKVNKLFGDLGKKKCQILLDESSKFFQTSLREMEHYLLKTIRDMVINAHANIVNDFTIEIKEKLKKEKKILDKRLGKKITIELKKIEEYYSLLLDNEICRKTQFINHYLVSRDEAYDIYMKQLEAENITGCMYVMSNERKKCYMRKINIEKLYLKEALETIQELKDRQQILTDFQRKPSLSTVNKDWENKIRKIIQLFVKFISFSLKLLPQQTTFLLEFQNILLLQMNEILQNPLYPKPTVVNVTKQSTEHFDIKFLKSQHYEPEVPCPEPFTIEGTLHPPTPRDGESRETLSLNAELPYFRVDRKYFYARCEKLEEITKMLQAMVCVCNQCVCPTPVTQTNSQEVSTVSEDHEKATLIEKKASNEGIHIEERATSLADLLPLLEYKRFEECPLNCYKKYVHELEFPPLNEYIDFTEEKYRIVKGMLSDLKIAPKPTLLDVNKLMDQYSTKLQFDPTKGIKYDEGTQYYSQESLLEDNVSLENVCKCEKIPFKIESKMEKKAIPTAEEIQTLRKKSLLNLINERPSIIHLFSDEWYNILQ